jgi:hypothetical protein
VACPGRELREPTAELLLQARDVCVVSDALEPLQHQRLSSLYCRTWSIDGCVKVIGGRSAGQRTAQRRLVIEIALDDVDAAACQRPRRPDGP